MILKCALDLIISIKRYRRDMYKLIENKGISDPDVIKISQKLDGQIIMLQKIIREMDSDRHVSFLIRTANRDYLKV